MVGWLTPTDPSVYYTDYYWLVGFVAHRNSRKLAADQLPVLLMNDNLQLVKAPDTRQSSVLH